MTALNGIDFYLSAGYVLTPLNGKIPTTPKWQNAKFDELFFCKGNFGVVLQNEDLVIDVDPRNGGQRETVDKWLGGLQTFTVQTGGGGWHYYFKKSPVIPILNVLPKYLGIEFKTKGQQVVGAGSKTAAEYIVINNAPVAQCPESVLQLITRPKDKLKQKTNKNISYVNDEQTQSRFIEFLTHCPIAVEGHNGDDITFGVACVGRDLALDEMTTFKLMLIHYNPRCVPPWPDEELNIKINNAYKYAQNDVGTLSPQADFEAVANSNDGVTGWEHDKNGKLKPSFRNTLNALLTPNLSISNLFRFNEFSEDIEFAKESPWHKSEKDSKHWTDADAVMLKEWLSNHYRFASAVSDIHEAVLAVSKRNSYHPIKDYFQALKWDGVERIRTWLTDYMGVEKNAYTMDVGEKVLCAAVARIFRPGIKYDYLMVLEGVQGQGKSRVCRALGGEWHIGLKLDPHNKDFIDYMRSKWVIEIEEMDFATKAESQGIKAFLSRDTDRARLAYARVTKDFPRQCIFIGTYNPIDGESTYLKDPTGNRRFWPIHVPQKKIEVERIAADRDQLWAEAAIKARTAKLFIQGEAHTLCESAQKIRYERDPWHEIISEWLADNIKVGETVNGATIFSQCLGGQSDNYTVFHGRRIAQVMRMLEWEKRSFWNAKTHNSDRGYWKPIKVEQKENIKINLDKLDI